MMEKFIDILGWIAIGSAIPMCIFLHLDTP